MPAPDDPLLPADPEQAAFLALALGLTLDMILPMTAALYQRLSRPGRRILVETTRDAIEGRL